LFLGEISVAEYFFSNILILLLAQIAFGVIIGVISAVFAVAKYLDGKVNE